MIASAPSISIITPVWNGLPFIRECVDSVLKQPSQDWEMLIGDNGSTDGTREYLRSLQDSRIRVFYHDANRGIFGNLNFLFEQATAPISQILCADDFMLDDGLEVIARTWQGQPDRVGAIRFNFADMKGSRCEVVQYFQQHHPTLIDPSIAPLYFFAFGNMPGNLSNMSVRTRAISEVGGFNQDYPYAGDFEFWIRLSGKYAIAMDGTDVIFVRRHPGVASNYLNTKGELVGQLRRIADELYRRLLPTCPRGILRLHATLTYDTLNRHVGFKRWLKTRNREFLNTLNQSSNTSDAFYKPISRWLLYFATGGGHWGRVWVVKRLLRSAKPSSSFLN